MDHSSRKPPLRETETRHSPTGKTCHHFQRFGLSCDEYDRLRERASGHCEICGAHESVQKRGLYIEHTVVDGLIRVRGLVCQRCNVVMSCMDGNKKWGANRKWEPRAARYVANSWHPLPAMPQ